MLAGPILLSQDNPKGVKLEELLPILQAEMLEKCRKIELAAVDCNDELAYRIFENNKKIIALFAEAEVLLRHNLRFLNEKGNSQGPQGKQYI